MNTEMKLTSSIKGGEFPDQLSDCQLLGKISMPWRYVVVTVLMIRNMIQRNFTRIDMGTKSETIFIYSLMHYINVCVFSIHLLPNSS